MATETDPDGTDKKQKNRRGKGEGSISKRPDGLWVARIESGTDANGKRKRKSVYGKTKKEVADQLTTLQHQRKTGLLVEESKLSVAAFLDRWLLDSVKGSTRPTTYESYSSHVENYIKPNVGSIKLAKLMPLHVARIYSTMAADGKSARLQQMVHATLHRALEIGMKWGLVARNVSDAVDRPKAPKVEFTTFTPDQTHKLLVTAAGDRLEALYVMAIGAGMRSGELLGLQWADIDLKAGSLSVRRTLIELGGKQSYGEPKSASGKRAIRLPGVVVSALWAHKARMMAEGHAGNPLVFVTTEGTPILRSDLRRHSWLPLLKKADLPTIRFHDLRHTSATLLLGEGVHPKIVQERLGHSTVTLTLNTYSHVMPSMQEDAASKLEGVMNRTIAINEAKASG